QEVRPETVGATALQPAAAPAAEPEPEADPEPATVSPLTRPGPRHAATSVPYLRRLAVAATIVAMAGSGLALGAWDAEPGSALWPVAKVFYAEKARSVEAAADVTKLHEAAREAIARGDRPAAAAALAAAEQQLAVVRPDEGRDHLVRLQTDLSGEVTGRRTTGGGTT